MNINTSKSMRSDNLFMRNKYSGHGKWNIPLIKKQAVDVENISLIACSDTRSNDNETNTKNGVHFFVDDYRFNGIYNNPEKSLRKYSQYAFLLSPDFSTYADMETDRKCCKKSLVWMLLARTRAYCDSNNQLEYAS